MQETVLAFFRNYELDCKTQNDAAAASAFAESFLYADKDGAKSLSRAVITAAAAQRRELVAKAGFAPSVLEEIEVHPLDARYAWARTVWRLDPIDGSSELKPIHLRATYLVEVEGSAVRVLAYLSHTGLMEALRGTDGATTPS